MSDGIGIGETFPPGGPFADQPLDPGIRDIVHAMWAAGLETHDSGDGVSKDADVFRTDYRHVMAYVEPADMYDTWCKWRAFAEQLGPEWRVDWLFTAPGLKPIIGMFEEEQ